LNDDVVEASEALVSHGDPATSTAVTTGDFSRNVEFS
jgi:hypothetical protein